MPKLCPITLWKERSSIKHEKFFFDSLPLFVYNFTKSEAYVITRTFDDPPLHSMSTTWFMNEPKCRRPNVADDGGNVRVSFGSCPWNCAGRRKAIPRSPEKTLHQWRIQQVGTTKKKDSNPCTCPHSTFFFSIRYMLEWPSLSKMINLPKSEHIFIKEIYKKITT